MGLPELMGAAILGSLVVYALLGGADYGGGLWDLLARGPRAGAQRALVARSIGPIWEANHVWLILAIVLLFTCFPPAFARIGTELHVPVTLALVGIVLRGSAFAFRSYGPRDDPARDRWGTVFAVASTGTPLLLGIVLGAIASGRVWTGTAAAGGVVRGIPGAGGAGGVASAQVPVDFVARFVSPWLSPFPLAVGAFALVLFAYLAAVYLTLETDDPALQEDFRRRALLSAVVTAAFALLVFLLSAEGAPAIRRDLARSPWTWPVQLATGAAAVAALASLLTRRYPLARLCAAAQVALIVTGWGLAQYPNLVEPDLTLRGASAPAVTLRLTAWTLGLGALVLLPCFAYLFRVFKGGWLGGPLVGRPSDRAGDRP